MMNLARRLRTLAAQCRQVPRPPYDGIAIELEGLACDYERDATRLEALAPDRFQARARRAGDIGRPRRPGQRACALG